MPKISSYGGMTPILTDLLYGVDDPGGTPISDSITITALRDLLEANFVTLTATDLTLGGDAILVRDAADVLGQHNGTNKQGSRVYNTFTDSSNGEWFEIQWVGNTCILGTNSNGSGQSHNLRIDGGVNDIQVGNAGIVLNSNVGDTISFTTAFKKAGFDPNSLYPDNSTSNLRLSSVGNNPLYITVFQPPSDATVHNLWISGGDANAAASTNVAGGHLYLYGGESATGSGDGGNIFVRGGLTTAGNRGFVDVESGDTGKLVPGVNVGTAGTGTTAVDYGDGYNFVTVLTMAGVLPAISAGANAYGLLVYTFPAGVTRVKSVHMDVGVDGNETNIDADTPEVGVGSVIATGSVAVLNGTTGFDDYVTEKTAANCTGTVTDFSFDTVDAGLTLNASGTKTLHLNVADTWAGTDTAAVLSGTVTIEWTFLGA